MPRGAADLAVRTAPTHEDLLALPAEEAFAELGRRHRRREPLAFRRGGRAGRTHLVRVEGGQPLCRVKLAEAGPQELSVTGPLTCPACSRVVARAIHRTSGRRARRVTPSKV